MSRTYSIAINIFLLGVLVGFLVMAIFLLATNNWERPHKTIARLEAERDSLKSGAYFRAKIEKNDYGQWLWFQSKNDSDKWFGVNLDSMKNHGQWPPETLKTTPMKRREK